MLDEDDTVKDLAIRALEELWFQTTTPQPSASKSRTGVASSNPHDKSMLLSKVAVIMGVSANFKDRHSPLEDVLHKIMADKQTSDASSLHDCYSEICETLIDGLVDASDLPGFVGSLTSTYPHSLIVANTTRLSLIASGQSFFLPRLTPPFCQALMLLPFYLTSRMQHQFSVIFSFLAQY
jgi:cohesin loading factor subunit SCC2